MDEADQLCHRLAIMDHGKILALDTPYALKRMVPGGNTVEMRVRRSQILDDRRIEQLLSQLKTLPGVERAEITTHEGRPIDLSEEGKDNQSVTSRGEPIRVIRLYSGRGGDLAAQAADTVSATGAELIDLRLTRPNLETVFVSLTGRGLRS
jgi:ABC-2 type transport system ATP-binding protein